MDGEEFCKENIGRKYLYSGEEAKIVGCNDLNKGVIITYKNGWSRKNLGVNDHIDYSILEESDSLYYVSNDELKEIAESNKKTVMETRNVKVTLETAQRWYGQGGEFKEMALSAYTEDELNQVKNEWESKILGEDIDGFYVSSLSYVIQFKNNCSKKDKATFKTEKQAKSALAYAQLTQLMALPEYNGDWVADWGNKCESKYCIIPVNKEIKIDLFYEYAQKICFKSYALASLFFKNNIDLLEQYFEID